jgi:hypothetical protein
MQKPFISQRRKPSRQGGLPRRFRRLCRALATASRLLAPITEVLTAGGTTPHLLATPGGWWHIPKLRPPTGANLPRSAATDVPQVRNVGGPFAGSAGLDPVWTYPIRGCPLWESHPLDCTEGI